MGFKATTTMMLMALLEDTPYKRSIYQNSQLDGIDIYAEYKLIQAKQSKLSANMRKAVVARYEREVARVRLDTESANS